MQGAQPPVLLQAPAVPQGGDGAQQGVGVLEEDDVRILALELLLLITVVRSSRMPPKSAFPEHPSAPDHLEPVPLCPHQYVPAHPYSDIARDHLQSCTDPGIVETQRCSQDSLHHLNQLHELLTGAALLLPSLTESPVPACLCLQPHYPTMLL